MSMHKLVKGSVACLIYDGFFPCIGRECFGKGANNESKDAHKISRAGSKNALHVNSGPNTELASVGPSRSTSATRYSKIIPRISGIETTMHIQVVIDEAMQCGGKLQHKASD